MAKSRQPKRSAKPEVVSPSGSRASESGSVWVCVALLAAVALWSYSNSFTGAFVGDDVAGIVENQNIRSLWPPSVPLTSPKESTLAGRPVVSLSFALNFAFAPAHARQAMTPDPSGRPGDPFYDNVWGYHFVNLVVHLLAGLALFGVVRRTLMTPVLRDRFGRVAMPLACSIAAIWLAHPLQTSSVTFVVQRAESLVGLFYLTTMYCVIRAGESDFRSRRWMMAAIGACVLGMASKEVMATAPVMAALWIWIFRPDVRLWAAPYRAAQLLGGLAATWIVVLIVASGARTQFIGFNVDGWTWWSYLTTQSEVIAHYLRLSFWPQGLSFNYAWRAAGSWREWAPYFIAIAALTGAAGYALIKRRPIGWLGAWFFLILAPTSSILPISTEVAAEFRMYLPLAAVVSLVVIGMYSLLRSWPAVTWIAVAAITLAMGTTTRARNLVYESVDTVMADVVKHQPEHAEARLTHATHLIRKGQFAEAETQLRTALALPLPAVVDEKTARAMTHMYLGIALNSQGRLPEGFAELEQAIALKPDLELAYGMLADAELSRKRPREALAFLERALVHRPDSSRLLARSAWILATSSDDTVRNGARAVQYAERAVRLTEAGDVAAMDTLAAAYAEAGNFTGAIASEENALALAPGKAPGLLPMLQSHLAEFEAGRPIRSGQW